MSNEQLVVTFDTDGVIADSQKPIVERFNRKFNKSLTVADWTEFDLLTKMAMELSGESVAVVAGWLFATEVMMEALPYPDSQRVMKELVDAGIQLSVCTSRPAEQAAATIAWMQYYFPDISNVFVRNGDNPGLRGNEFKLETAISQNAMFYVDDDAEMIRGVLQAQSQDRIPRLRHAIQVDRPWNDKVKFPPSVIRVGDWKQNDFGWLAIRKAILGARDN